MKRNKTKQSKIQQNIIDSRLIVCLVIGSVVSTNGDMIFGGSLNGNAFFNGAGSLQQHTSSLPIDFGSTSTYLYK